MRGLACKQAAPRHGSFVGEANAHDLTQIGAHGLRSQQIDGAVAIDDCNPCARVVQADLQGLRAEQGRERHERGADAENRQGHDRFRALTEHDGNPVAGLNTHAQQPIGELADGLVQASVGPHLALPGGVFMKNCDPACVGRALSPTPTADLGDVELRGHQPRKRLI